MDEMCHVDVVFRVMGEEQEARSRGTPASRGRGRLETFLPFPLSFCPTAAKILLSVNAGKAQIRLAKGTEVTLDAYIQEAGLEAWTLLVTWALNFVYCNRHAERAERPESLSAAQQKALVQLKDLFSRISVGPRSASFGLGKRAGVNEDRLQRMRR